MRDYDFLESSLGGCEKEKKLKFYRNVSVK